MDYSNTKSAEEKIPIKKMLKLAVRYIKPTNTKRIDIEENGRRHDRKILTRNLPDVRPTKKTDTVCNKQALVKKN